MSDTKRILVWLFVLVWCVLSLCVDVRAQEFAPIPEFTEQRCSEPVDVAANTIVIKKKAVASVPAGGGGITFTYRSSITEDGTDWTVALPTGSAAGDFVVAILLWNNQTANLNVLDGFTENYHYHTTGDGVLTISVLSKVVASGDVTAGNFTFGFTATPGYGDAILLTYQIAGGTPTYDTGLGADDDTANASLLQPRVTTQGGHTNELIVYGYWQYIQSTTTAISVGATQRATDTDNTFGAADEQQATSGSQTDQRTITFGSANGNKHGVTCAYY